VAQTSAAPGPAPTSTSTSTPSAAAPIGAAAALASTAADPIVAAAASIPAAAPTAASTAASVTTDAAASLPAVPAAAAEPPIETASQPARAYTAAAQGFWVQLGAFRDAGGAVDFQRRVQAELDWLAPLLAIFNDHHLHRLQAGPYQTRSDAVGAAQRIRLALQLVPVIVERR
jgi:rare lipoprotein A